MCFIFYWFSASLNLTDSDDILSKIENETNPIYPASNTTAAPDISSFKNTNSRRSDPMDQPVNPSENKPMENQESQTNETSTGDD